MNPLGNTPPDTTAETSDTAEIPVTTAEPTTDEGSSGVSDVVLIIAIVVASFAAFLLGRFTKRSQLVTSTPRPPEHQVVAQPSEEPPQTIDNETERQRKRLVDVLIEFRDRLEPGEMSTRIGAALADARVETLDPTGEPFDVSNHVANPPPMPTDDPTLDGRVAAILQYGYRDRGTVLRLATVVVYRYAKETGQ